jgi:hypothetical protein
VGDQAGGLVFGLMNMGNYFVLRIKADSVTYFDALTIEENSNQRSVGFTT